MKTSEFDVWTIQFLQCGWHDFPIKLWLHTVGVLLKWKTRTGFWVNFATIDEWSKNGLHQHWFNQSRVSVLIIPSSLVI